MKKTIILWMALISLFHIATAQNATQPKTDVLLKVNGDELEGKVVEINDEDIKFTYEGESLIYKIKKQDILKITYGSGRIEFFNKQPLSSEKNTSANSSNKNLEDHHNKVAILPFGYIKNSQSASDEMSTRAQNAAYALLSKHSGEFTVVDPRTTNALLAKAGINRANLAGYTMDEICNILGVEYVVDGTITQNIASSVTTSTNSGESRDSKKEGEKKYNETSSIVNTANYQTNVTLNIYTDKNNNIYSEDRRALFVQNEGAYDSPLQYLLKRSPLYRK